MGELGSQVVVVAEEVGRFPKQLVEEEEEVVVMLRDIHKWLAQVGMEGGVGEEEEVEEVQGGEVGGLLLLDVDGGEGVQTRQVAGEEEWLEEGGG